MRNFRMRARFGITTVSGKLRYIMFKNDINKLLVDEFPIASTQINLMMPRLLECLALEENVVLREGIEMVAYLTTQLGESVITLYYSKMVEPKDEWLTQARVSLMPALGGASIIARCKGGGRYRAAGKDGKKSTKACGHPSTWPVEASVGPTFVNEQYTLQDGRKLKYMIPEGSFSNPNAAICEKTLEFLSSVSEEISKAQREAARRGVPRSSNNLLELYCGNGNHTVALAPQYETVVAVEIDAALCNCARENLKVNEINNGLIVCSPSQKFCGSGKPKPKHPDPDPDPDGPNINPNIHPNSNLKPSFG